MNLKSTQRDTLLSDGNYNKKTWVDDEIIYKEDLNTLEDIAYKNREAILQQNEKIDQIPTMSDVDKIDYMGKQHTTLKSASDANMEYLLRKVNTQKYEGSSITATNTYAKQISNVILKGATKYKDIDTGEFIDSFEEGRNLILVGGKTNKVFSETHVEAISRGLIEMSGVYESNIVKKDNANFTIKTTGFRWTGVKSSRFFTSQIGGVEFGKYIIEFDGKLISGDISEAHGINLGTINWSEFVKGYDRKIPTNGKYRAVIKSSTNTVNGRSTNFGIYTTNGNSVSNPVEYEVTNLKVYCVEKEDEVYQSSYIDLPSLDQLYSIGDVFDSINLATGIYTKNIGIRPYENDDENNSDVITDMINTIYKLEEPIITRLDLQGQKVYSYDGTTHYSCQSELGYPAPLLLIEVPTDLASLVNEQSNKIVELQSINKEQDEIINTSLLATDEIYMMLEPLLVNSLAVDQSNKMVNLYVAMVERGLKDKEEVPAIYKEQVLKELEK